MDSRQPLLECTLPSLPQFPYPAKNDHLCWDPKRMGRPVAKETQSPPTSAGRAGKAVSPLAEQPLQGPAQG